MKKRVIVIGAGMGGLAASLRLARRNFQVRVLEARGQAGGLASAVEIEGLRFDAGPYILLDRNGLEWSFRALGLELEELVALNRLEDVYQVGWSDGTRVRFYRDLEQTAAAFEGQWPGSGHRYIHFVRSCIRRYEALSPLLYKSHPRPWDLVTSRTWRHSVFLASSLGHVLRTARLPQRVTDAIAIWTHIAGQDPNCAPSVMAFVPALIHTAGAYYPNDGIGRIPGVLAEAAAAAGVEFSYNTKAARIRSVGGQVVGVELTSGEFLAADAVVSDSGIGTYVELLDETRPRSSQRLKALPLQSPGVMAYLSVRARNNPQYLQFHIPGDGDPGRLLAIPSLARSGQDRPDCDSWYPARLIVPMPYNEACCNSQSGQREYLDRALAENWWKEYITEHRVLSTRVPREWGIEFNLYRDSMNPVMTARFMRQGRLPHRSPWFKGLYLTGSATHPGQWVSFCAISGVLAADRLCEDVM
jgi:phytoene dehydrogenase-like protein